MIHVRGPGGGTDIPPLRCACNPCDFSAPRGILYCLLCAQRAAQTPWELEGARCDVLQSRNDPWFIQKYAPLGRNGK